MLGDVGSSREPVLNSANMSCQQLSRSSESEWDFVDKCTCGAGDGDGAATEPPEASDSMDRSFTTSGTVGTEGDSTHLCASRVESDFPPRLTETLEVSMPLMIHRWVSEGQGVPWNPLATESFRATQDLEVGTAFLMSWGHS